MCQITFANSVMQLARLICHNTFASPAVQLDSRSDSFGIISIFLSFTLFDLLQLVWKLHSNHKTWFVFHTTRIFRITQIATFIISKDSVQRTSMMMGGGEDREDVDDIADTERSVFALQQHNKDADNKEEDEGVLTKRGGG